MLEKLIIPSTFEEMTQEMNGDISKLSQIIQPVTSSEENINVILSNIKNSGYLAFFLGHSGTGKSTFISSLSWRSHIRKRAIVNIDASEILPIGGLSELFKEISKIASQSNMEKDVGPTIIVVDYMESMEDIEDAHIKGFFRSLNGLLRKSAILIIWPVTSLEDAQQMISIAKIISTTMFYHENEIIRFTGPSENTFSDIARRTITFLNKGKEPSEFGITNDTFQEIETKYSSLPAIQKSIRRYLQLLKSEWETSSKYLQKLKLTIPKPIEVWCVFCYFNAESVVSQFSRKGQTVDETWTPIHDKFYEYIPGSQRSSIWDATRLQLALFGYIKTRVMFLPTNALISVLYAYSEHPEVIKIIEGHRPPKHWKKKTVAKTFLSSSPMYKQLIGEKYPVGLRKGGPAAKAMDIASPIFSDLNKLLTKSSVSDVIFNKAIAECISEMSSLSVVHQKPHPWLNKIIPDILANIPEKNISLEFHYTDDDSAYKIADYTLNKLNVYMNQIEEIVNK